MNDAHIKEKMQRIVELCDSIADEYQHALNVHSSTGVPPSGVGPVCQLVRIIDTAERAAFDFSLFLNHPADLAASALAGVVSDAGRLEPDAGASPCVAAGDG